MPEIEVVSRCFRLSAGHPKSFECQSMSSIVNQKAGTDLFWHHSGTTCIITDPHHKGAKLFGTTLEQTSIISWLIHHCNCLIVFTTPKFENVQPQETVCSVFLNVCFVHNNPAASQIVINIRFCARRFRVGRIRPVESDPWKDTRHLSNGDVGVDQL